MQYNIIDTGSHGNAVIINEIILIDCGVSFKKLKDVYRDLQIVLLTHIHKDHFNEKTIARLANERPTLRWACGEWLVAELISCGVSPKYIDTLQMGLEYDYSNFKIIPVKLYHNVLNFGYRISMAGKRGFYATDTNTLEGVSAIGYDLYMVEANYEDEEIMERIRRKEALGIYAYEYNSLHNHLSRAKCDEWLFENKANHSRHVYLHKHIERGGD